MVIVAAAAAVRLFALSTQPGGLYMDEAAEGVDALRILHQPNFHPIFFDDDGGREATYAYLVAGAFRLLGASPVVLRGVSAVIGVAGVAALYPFLRRFGSAATLIGMLYSAGALWLIAISRDGFRPILVAPALALSLWALLRWSEKPSPGRAMLAGAAAGAGLWTYQPLKLLPLFAVVWLLILWRWSPERAKSLRQGLPAALLGYLAIAAPMMLVAVTDPAGYFGRTAAVSPFGEPAAAGGLATHVLRTFGMFGFTGDPNARHDVAGLPLAGWPIVLLMLLGLKRAWLRRSEAGYALLLAGLPVFILPPLLAPAGGSPHFLRSLGLAPFMAGLVGIGALQLAELTSRVTHSQRAHASALALCGLLLALTGLGGASAYFSRPEAQRYDAYAFDVVQLAEAARRWRAAAVTDGYRGYVVRFLDYPQVPLMVKPGSRLEPLPGRAVVARTRADLAAAIGAGAAEQARVVAVDPAGRPAVWLATAPPS